MLALKLESLDFESRVVSCAPYRVQRNSNRGASESAELLQDACCFEGVCGVALN
jgi:hypothetical protein